MSQVTFRTVRAESQYIVRANLKLLVIKLTIRTLNTKASLVVWTLLLLDLLLMFNLTFISILAKTTDGDFLALFLFFNYWSVDKIALFPLSTFIDEIELANLSLKPWIWYLGSIQRLLKG